MFLASFHCCGISDVHDLCPWSMLLAVVLTAVSLMRMIYALDLRFGSLYPFSWWCEWSDFQRSCHSLSACSHIASRCCQSLKIAGSTCVQLLGGGLAGFTCAVMETGKSFPLGPGQDYTWLQAGFAEVIFTSLLCYVVGYTATVQDAPLCHSRRPCCLA